MTQPTAQIRHVVSRTGFSNPLTLGVLVEDIDYLKVYADVDLLQIGVDYTVLGIGDPGGVSITIIGAEDPNEYVGVETFTALYDPVLQQGADLALGGAFGRAFESALDAQNRQLQAVADQMLRVPPGAPTGMVVPREPGAALVWNDEGDGFLALPVATEDGYIASIAGPGVPAGGTSGKALVKTADTDFTTGWATVLTPADIGVTVQAYDATTLNAAAIGVTVQGYDAATLKADVEDQGITGGARVTPKNLGNLSGASITPDPGDRPIQTITNNGAGSILPGSNEGQYTLQIINTTGAGAITTTGWTLKGDSFDTTTTSRFVCSCLVTSDIKLMTIVKVA